MGGAGRGLDRLAILAADLCSNLVTTRGETATERDVKPLARPRPTPAQVLPAVTAFLILSAQCFLLVGSIRSKSPTIDEPHHLAIGVSTLASLDFRMCRDDPPLQNMLNAVPVLVLGKPVPPFDTQSWIEGRNYGGLAHAFVEANRGRILDYMWWARLVSVAIALATSTIVFFWAKDLFGVWAAVVCLVVAAFEPTMLAHGRLVTTDALAAFLVAATCYATWRYAEKSTTMNLAAVAVSLGMAMATKHSSLLLWPFVLLVVVARSSRRRPNRNTVLPNRVRRVAFRVTALVAGSGLVLWSLFGFEVGDSVTVDRPPILDPLWSSVYQAGQVICGTVGLQAPFGSPNDPEEWTWAAMRRWLPAFSYWESLVVQAGHARRGHWANFRGDVGRRGWWLYYPVLLVTKTTISFLVLVALGFLLLLGDRRYSWIDRVILAGPPVFLFFVLVFVNRAAIGIRHLLPVFPVLSILAGCVTQWPGGSVRVGRTALKILLGLLLILHAAEAIKSYPHFIPYYNQFARLAGGGFRVATDSNLDWGQDLPLLAKEVERRGIGSLYLIYFGSLDFPSLYGLKWRDPDYSDLCGPGWWAISATCLSGIGSRFTRDDLACFREMDPVAVPGHSIYLFHIPRS